MVCFETIGGHPRPLYNTVVMQTSSVDRIFPPKERRPHHLRNRSSELFLVCERTVVKEKGQFENQDRKVNRAYQCC